MRFYNISFQILQKVVFVERETDDKIEVCSDWNVFPLSTVQLRNYDLYNG
jgi:hypothetical protein